jgi:hypothetical protein
MAKAVFGLVDTESQAERIVDNLKAAGFRNNDISVLFPDKGGTRDFAHEKATKAPEGAAAGAGTGTVVGGVLGWLVLSDLLLRLDPLWLRLPGPVSAPRSAVFLVR